MYLRRMSSRTPIDRSKLDKSELIRGVIKFICRFMYLVSTLLSLFGIISCVISVFMTNWVNALVFITISALSIYVALHSAEGG